MKTNLLTTSFIILSISFYAQETKGVLFYVDSLHHIANKKNYTYTRIVEDYNTTKDYYMFSEFYKSGIRRMKAMSKDKDKLIINGERIDYYPNGNKKQQSTYKNNYLNGTQTEWYENENKKIERIIKWDHKKLAYTTQILQFWNNDNEQKIVDGNGEYEETTKLYSQKGSVKNNFKQGIWTGNNFKQSSSFSETYDKGELISGTSLDINNIKYYYTAIEERPSPKKGISDFFQYIGKNFRHPEEALRNGVNGKIYFSFYVDKNGVLTDPKLDTEENYGYKDEITRLIINAEKWNPGKIRGIPLKVKYSMPIEITRK